MRSARSNYRTGSRLAGRRHGRPARALPRDAAEPARFTAKIAKQSRGGKIFVDYLRNAETASAVAAYSPRARPGAYVSTPLDWDELGSTDIRSAFTVKNLPERLRSLRVDPWAGYHSVRQTITDAMRKALA